MKIKSLLNFLFEAGHLKQIKHEGWRMAGVYSPESVAEHGLRAAQIGFVLAHLENFPEPEKICTMLVFHDIGEARIGDVHTLAKSYLQIDERKAVEDQVRPLGQLGQKILRLWEEVEEAKTTAGKIARDADKLEQALTAKEYFEQGYKPAELWIDAVEKLLFSSSAKTLLVELKHTDSTNWWRELEQIKAGQSENT